MRINSKGSIRKEKRYEVFALGLVLVHFLLLVGGLPEVNVTADEPAYIAGGYALLKRGTEALAFLSQRGYPPLLAGLEALLLYVADPSIPVNNTAGSGGLSLGQFLVGSQGWATGAGGARV
jgi:hypothetical protein